MYIQVFTNQGRVELSADPGETLLAVLRRHAGLGVEAPCGGRGSCKKCKAYLVLPDGEKEVLLCQTKAQEGTILRLPEKGELCVVLEAGKTAQVPTDAGNTGYGIACDIGTTTLVCKLIGRNTGRCVASLGAENPQRGYGADVMSRIQAATQGQQQAMTVAVQRQLSRMIEELGQKAQVAMEEIKAMAVAANTTMAHLLVGLSPQNLGVAPYQPSHFFGDFWTGEALGMPFRGEVYLAPAVSGFVGGDITADILAAGLDQAGENTLLIDVGTNGELVLGHGSRFYACATAAGPAFEGSGLRCGMTAAPGAISQVEWRWGQITCSVIGGTWAKGICGSGLVDAVAVLLEAGAIDHTGRMLHPDQDELPEELEPYLYLVDGEPAFCLMDDIAITQSDVRKLQLCKAAIGAGIARLLELHGENVHELLLAGGFGSYIRPESAARIGLIPKELLSVTKVVGNLAVRGAQMALCSHEARKRLGEIQKNVEYLELSGDPSFQDKFIEMMSFPL